jgi:hypothetical protein
MSLIDQDYPRPSRIGLTLREELRCLSALGNEQINLKSIRVPCSLPQSKACESNVIQINGAPDRIVHGVGCLQYCEVMTNEKSTLVHDGDPRRLL